VRIPLAGADPWISLAEVAAMAGVPQPKVTGGSAEELYAAEQEILSTQRLIPLFHLPATYAASPALKSWSPRPDGTWSLADSWLGNEKP
jgi:hypothetical protein